MEVDKEARELQQAVRGSRILGLMPEIEIACQAIEKSALNKLLKGVETDNLTGDEMISGLHEINAGRKLLKKLKSAVNFGA